MAAVMVEILDLDALRVGLRGSLAALPHLAAAGQPDGAQDRILIRRGKCGEADGHLPAVGGIGAAFRAAALVLDRRGCVRRTVGYTVIMEPRGRARARRREDEPALERHARRLDRKSTRLNSSH